LVLICGICVYPQKAGDVVLEQSGLIFNIQKYSVHDGPGIRTTVFLKGCPLHCVWCHNPEGISHQREMMVLENRCIGCQQCRLACRYGTEIPGDSALPPRSEVCELCGACVEACPTQGRQIIGQEVDVDQVLEAVLQDQLFYEDSGGGVTFSGGEPLSQPQFLRGLLDACRERGLHTAVDTCGLARREDLLAVAALADLFLYDIKFMDEAKHRRYTGVSNDLILENLQALGRVHSQIWVRVPLIAGINDDPADLEATADFAATVPGVRQVNLLPFHRNGLPKAIRLGHESREVELDSPDEESMGRAEEVFRAVGMPVKRGG
jgi:pyruvate formate lyase activating enzyme